MSDAAIDMYQSLRDACEAAGGNPYFFKKAEVMNMTVSELIAHLCTNSIRFVYQPKYQEQIKQETETLKSQVRDLNVQFDDLVSTLDYKNQTILSLNEAYENLFEDYQEYKEENERVTFVAKSIVDYLHKNCYSDVKDFEPFEHLEGLMSQISNMVTGVTNKENYNETLDKLCLAEREIRNLKSDIFHLESSLDHSYSAEEVTEKIDRLVDLTGVKLQECILEVTGFKDISSSGEYTVLKEFDKRMKGNWKYNL